MKKFIIGFIVFSVLFAGCNQGKQNPTKSGTNPGSTSAPPPTSNEQNGPLVLNLNWAAEAEIDITDGKHNFKFTISDQNTVFTVFDKNNPKDLGEVFGMQWDPETKKISSPDSKDAEFEITFTDTPLPVSEKEPKTWKAKLNVLKEESNIYKNLKFKKGTQEVSFKVTYNKDFVKNQ